MKFIKRMFSFWLGGWFTWVATAIGGSAVLGLAGTVYGANKMGQPGTPPSPRNFGNEVNQIQGAMPGFGYNAWQNASTYNPQYTNLNLGNYNQAVGGVAGGMQGYWNQANPGLAGYTGGLQQYLNQVTQNTPQGVPATGYDAATSQGTSAGPAAQAGMGGPGYNPVRAQSVGTNWGFGQIGAPQNDYGLSSAMSRLGSTGPSAIQQSLESQAYNDLQLGGSLSPEEIRNTQQAAREAWGARGLINSNGAVAEEALNRDALSRQRLNERNTFAQGADATGFGQRQQGFTNALGVSDASRGYAGLGLQAAQSNLGAQLQTNQLGMQGQLANQNAGLQAGMANQNNGLGYANLFTNNSQYNTGQSNNMAQFNANLGQQNNQFNAGANNQAQQYNTGAVNNMNQFNQNLGFQGNQNTWNNALQYGQFQMGQAQNPFNLGLGLMGQAPDYTNALLGYGNDVYGTNYNGQAAANISNGNNGAALVGAGLGIAGNAAGLYARYGQPTSYGGQQQQPQQPYLGPGWGVGGGGNWSGFNVPTS